MDTHALGNATLHTGDCLDVLFKLPDASVQTCITSPPYYALRDYGVAGQIGLEDSLEEYIGTMVEVFHAVRRLLTDDGTLWLNIGDTYCGAPGGKQGANGATSNRTACRNGSRERNHPIAASGVKNKDLMGVPWRLAFALQADGWFLRQDIIWHKPNPMPESVKDRCTKAHEYLFLLSKSDRYYFDQEAIAEPATWGEANSPQSIKSPYGQGFTRTAKKVPTGWDTGEGGHRDMTGRYPKFGGEKYGESEEVEHRTKSGKEYAPNGMRNKRSVWTVPTQPYAGAHFATFPPELIRPCVMAGCPGGGTVLDPFSGSGTTGAVALQEGRRYVGIELSPEYQALAIERITPFSQQERLFA